MVTEKKYYEFSMRVRECHGRDFFKGPLRRILIILIAISLLASAFYTIGTRSATSIGIIGLSSTSSHFTMFGADQVIQGGAESFSFVQGVASQGLKWDRDSWGDTNLVWDYQAGINVLALMGGSDPETSCGSGVLQSESSYKAMIQSNIDKLPWIHHWEYGNEIQSYWCNISPQNYFQGLVWAYEVISTTPGHTTDTIQGPTETIFTSGATGVWDGYDGCGTVSCVDGWNGKSSDKIGWFYTFWHQSITDSLGTWTPAKILSYVSLHVYTEGQLFSDKPSSGPYASVGAMLTAALNVYYSITGNSKDFVISETGFRSDTSGGTSEQATWYEQMMPFYQSIGFVTGVFVYALYDTQPQLWGLFTSSLQPKPAWSVYQSYLSGISTSSSTSSTTMGSTSSFSTQRSSSSSSTVPLTTQTSSSTSTKTSSSVASSNSSSTTQTSSTHGHNEKGQGSNQTSTSPSGSSSLYQSMVGMLAVLSPAKDPPAAYGLATYEIFLIGVLFGVLMIHRRSGQIDSRKGHRWRW